LRGDRPQAARPLQEHLPRRQEKRRRVSGSKGHLRPVARMEPTRERDKGVPRSFCFVPCRRTTRPRNRIVLVLRSRIRSRNGRSALKVGVKGCRGGPSEGGAWGKGTCEGEPGRRAVPDGLLARNWAGGRALRGRAKA